MNLKNNKAITLIALIVTIIILLILSTVTISSISGNGLFSKARESKIRYEQAEKNEIEIINSFVNEIDHQVIIGEIKGIISDNIQATLRFNGESIIGEGTDIDINVSANYNIRKVELKIGNNVLYRVTPNAKEYNVSNITLNSLLNPKIDIDNLHFGEEKIRLVVTTEVETAESEELDVFNYTIGNGNALKELASYVNSGNGTSKTLSGKTITQIANVEVQNYTPIGYQNSATEFAGPYFAGTYKGNNYTIKINSYSLPGDMLQGQGIFGMVIGGTIEKVTSVGNVTLTKDYAGGIVGKMKEGTIEKCINDGTVNGGTQNRIAGIVGHCDGTNIKQCINKKSISARSIIGGIVGSEKNTPDKEVSIEYCYNNASISGCFIIGGIVGGISGGNTKYINLINCYNKERITSSGESSANNDIMCAGISGNTSGKCKTYHCYNIGEVSSTNNAGNYVSGLSGALMSSGTNGGEVKYCYNNANVSYSKAGAVSGVIGYFNSNCTVIDCYIGSSVTISNSSNTASKDIGSTGNVTTGAGYLIGRNNSGSNSITTIGGTTFSTSTSLGKINTMPNVYEVVNGSNGTLNNETSTIWDSTDKNSPQLKWELEI